jgi:hypothetical protein
MVCREIREVKNLKKKYPWFRKEGRKSKKLRSGKG